MIREAVIRTEQGHVKVRMFIPVKFRDHVSLKSKGKREAGNENK